ncbi:SNARE domain protein [Aspergillus heteromorphus CBS 117.55]|uniref:t-SNARE affecting a late Golgi compartment protein 1 n=1 Tax=Aspergillus heteromorphus CBS 117.55 TaxID=1448321 RepID=A0A317VZD1_9EURO|nr:SNARE domain protein [Aspergillus heteromorphus CBS 117.55]PWY79716.1 SNARE domain protein [Aspergillus heteromorphus CBS 117.55]
MRYHGVGAFDPILTLNPWTGEQSALTVHSLVRFFQRHNIARDLSRHIVPSVWGPFCDDGNPEMDFDAELRLAQRLERGLLVLFHMADIARDTERLKPRRKPMTPVVSGRLFVLGKMLDEYDDLPQHRKQLMSFEDYTNHVYTVLKWGYVEADIGRRRLEFRGWLDEQTEIDFHASLRMLRELMERMLLRHGPKDWHRDAKNEYSVISWFLLKQPPRSLAKLFLSPQNECCDLDVKATDCGVRKCRFSDPLDNYWKAWKNVPDLGCQDCDCKRRVRSWSVKPALIDARGREFNRAAERYLREIDVLSTLQTTRPLFSSYLRIRSLAKTPNNPELQQARSELETTLTDLTADLDDLVESVRAIEQDPYRFGLELEEVQRRRSLVNDVGAEVEKMRLELLRAVNNSTTNTNTNGHGNGGLPNPADFDDDHDGLLSPDAGGDYYAAMEQQRQMELMHEQDEQLDGVFRTVGNLRQQADDMGRELEEQAVIIDEVDTLAERVGGKLQSGMSKLKYIIRKNEDTMSSFCIAVLIFVLVLLLILLIVL